MLPPAPDLFSTKNWRPKTRDKYSLMMRAPASVEPPAGKGTITRTGRDGYGCALADPDTIGSAAAPAARCRKFRRGSFILHLLSLHITRSPRRRGQGWQAVLRGRASSRF